MGCLLYINNFSKAQNFLAEGIPKNMGFEKTVLKVRPLI